MGFTKIQEHEAITHNNYDFKAFVSSDYSGLI